MKFLLENMNKKRDRLLSRENEVVDIPHLENSVVDIESVNTIEYTNLKRHHHSFS